MFFFFSEQPFYANYLTLDSHINTVIFQAAKRLPTRQDGVENRYKVYNILFDGTKSCCK